MVPVHLRIPAHIRDYYMQQTNMSAAMREALRAHVEAQLAKIN